MTRKQFIFSLVRVICYVLLLAAALALIFSPLPEYTPDSDEIDAGAQLAQGLGTALLAIFFVVFKFFSALMPACCCPRSSPSSGGSF